MVMPPTLPLCKCEIESTHLVFNVNHMVNLLELEDSKITGQTTIPKREKVAAVVGLRNIK